MDKSIAKNIVFKVLLNLFNIIVPIIIGPYAYRVLGPGSMGIVTYNESIYAYFFIFASFGIYNYGLREISRIRDDKEKLKKFFTSLLVIGVISNLAVIIIYYAFAYVEFYNTKNFAALLVFSINIFSNIFYVEWVNEALEQYSFITKKTIIVKVIYLIALLTLVKTPDDYLKYIFFLTFSTFLNNIISFIYISKEIGYDFSEITIKRHLKYLFFSLLMANAHLLYLQLDRVMIGSFINELQVSYYALCFNIINIINTLILSVVYVTVPRLSNILGLEDEVSYQALLNKVTKILLAFLLPAAIGMICLSEEIIVLFSGTEYYESIPLLKIFSIYMITAALSNILANQVLYVKRKENILVTILLAGGILNFLLNMLLLYTDNFSSYSAIWTTVIANSLVILSEYLYARIKLKVPMEIFNKSTLKYLLTSLAFIPITYVVKYFFSGVILVTLTTIILCGFLYALVLLVSKDIVFFSIWNIVLKKMKKN